MLISLRTIEKAVMLVSIASSPYKKNIFSRGVFFELVWFFWNFYSNFTIFTGLFTESSLAGVNQLRVSRHHVVFQPAITKSKSNHWNIWEKINQHLHMWRFARFGTICAILKMWKIHSSRSVTTRMTPATLLKVTILHGCFSRFLNWIIGPNCAKPHI